MVRFFWLIIHTKKIAQENIDNTVSFTDDISKWFNIFPTGAHREMGIFLLLD